MTARPAEHADFSVNQVLRRRRIFRFRPADKMNIAGDDIGRDRDLTVRGGGVQRAGSLGGQRALGRRDLAPPAVIQCHERAGTGINHLSAGNSPGIPLRAEQFRGGIDGIHAVDLLREPAKDGRPRRFLAVPVRGAVQDNVHETFGALINGKHDRRRFRGGAVRPGLFIGHGDSLGGFGRDRAIRADRAAVPVGDAVIDELNVSRGGVRLGEGLQRQGAGAVRVLRGGARRRGRVGTGAADVLLPDVVLPFVCILRERRAGGGDVNISRGGVRAVGSEERPRLRIAPGRKLQRPGSFHLDRAADIRLVPGEGSIAVQRERTGGVGNVDRAAARLSGVSGENRGGDMHIAGFKNVNRAAVSRAGVAAFDAVAAEGRAVNVNGPDINACRAAVVIRRSAAFRADGIIRKCRREQNRGAALIHPKRGVVFGHDVLHRCPIQNNGAAAREKQTAGACDPFRIAVEDEGRGFRAFEEQPAAGA